MRLTLFVILCFLFVGNGYAQHFNISGVVSNQSGAYIENAHVLVKGASKGVYTNKKGAYTIQVKRGDTLLFSYLGMRTTEFFVKKEVTTILDIELTQEEEILDSVFIKNKGKGYSQKELLAEYHQNKTIIKTSMGLISKDRASFAIQIIDGENLIPIGSDFLYSLENFYPSMRVDREDKNLYDPKVYFQSLSYESQPKAIFDVDGVIYEQTPTFLDVSDIDRVAVLLRSGAVSRYGTAGIGGVIIINTKSGNFISSTNINKSYDNSELRDSLQQVINSPSVYAPEQPLYIKRLNKSKSESQALALFENQKKDHLKSPYYFIDAANFFINKWSNKQKALEIFKLVTNRFSTDVSVLKIVAFKYEELNQLDLAFQVYSMILKLNPKHSQSYRDLSNSLVKLKNYKSSINRYLSHESTIKKYDSVDFNDSEVGAVMKTELANIIKLHGRKLAVSDKVIDGVIESPNTRLLFEWNNNQAEFEIRMVDTEKNYYSWKQLRPKNNTIRQFFFDDTFTENKHIQIVYHGNQTKTPTYLKVTLFYNYGKHNQISKSAIFKLLEEDVNFQLLTFNSDKAFITN